ncbi:hypothetical protein BDQ17DRAFT_1179657, partial [Cyathus striatus]
LSLSEGAISNVQALKPPEHCREGQWFAHFAIAFSTRDQANKAIRNGLVVAGKCVLVHRRLEELKQCLHCQHIGGHLSGACKASEPVCACCAEHHNTAMCPLTSTLDHSRLRCANCLEDRTGGHGAASRSCPTFLQKLQSMFTYSAANKYKFFPTDDPSSW